jgi:hypothetical protein
VQDAGAGRWVTQAGSADVNLPPDNSNDSRWVRLYGKMLRYRSTTRYGGIERRNPRYKNAWINRTNRRKSTLRLFALSLCLCRGTGFREFLPRELCASLRPIAIPIFCDDSLILDDRNLTRPRNSPEPVKKRFSPRQTNTTPPFPNTTPRLPKFCSTPKGGRLAKESPPSGKGF